MSTPCPPSSSDQAADCNASAPDMGPNVLRFPVERCRKPRPAGDRWTLAGPAETALTEVPASSELRGVTFDYFVRRPARGRYGFLQTCRVHRFAVECYEGPGRKLIATRPVTKAVENYPGQFSTLLRSVIGEL